MKESGPVWETLRRLPQRLGKFKYPVLILLLGVLLLLLPRPSGREAEPEATAPAVEERSTLAVEETRLANLLSRIQGAGAVEVMLSLKSGSKSITKPIRSSKPAAVRKKACGRRTIRSCTAPAVAHSRPWCSR